MRQKLLLADDSITVQRVIELTLADEDLDVLTVGDGEQAVECLAREQPDIVLADVNMPGRDGYGVAEFVKQSPEYAGRTRVVLLTGAFEPIDQARADRIGIDGVLAKPFEPQVAIDLVRRVLSQPPVRPATRPVPAPAPAPVPGPAAAPAPTAAAAGYPFEPGAPASKSAELDEYFKRLDEALASAGHRPSPEPIGPVTRKVKGRPMIETQQSASTDVTLGDAFSALLAAEQGEPSAATLPASAFSASALVSEVSHTPHSGQLAAAQPPAAQQQPVISEELLETVIRRVLEQMSDRLVRELVGPKVLDVAERLVREEISRLKAEADSLDS